MTTDVIHPDHRIAAALSPRILLREISFLAVEGRRTADVPAGTLDYHLPKVVVHWGKHDLDITALFPFSLIAETNRRAGGPHVATPVAEISVITRLDYRLVEANGSIPPEQLPHVIGILGYMHAWPYFRADVQWLTTKLGLPSLVLPVVLSGQVPERVAIAPRPLAMDAILPARAEAPVKTERPPRSKAKRKRGRASSPRR